jgi:plastocyanin
MGLSRAEGVGFIIAVVVVIVMGVIALGGPYHKVVKTQASGSQLRTLNVKIVNDPKIIGRYVPAAITVHVGQRVIFSNVSNQVHTVTANEGHAFDSKDIPTNGGSWQFVPHTTGTFKYFCVYHPGMLGSIKVVA